MRDFLSRAEPEGHNIHLTQSSFKDGTDIVTAGLACRNQNDQSEHYLNRLLLEKIRKTSERGAESCEGPEKAQHKL